MPIPTDGSAWKRGDDYQGIPSKILQFLSNHPDEAFRPREIADVVMDTEWEIGEERERFIQRVGEDEYFENRDKYRDQEPEDQENVQVDFTLTVALEIEIGNLVRQGFVESRKVSGDEVDTPFDWDQVTHYTYGLE